MEIEVCQRPSHPMAGGAYHFYHAQIKNKPNCWGTGPSITEAIGDLVRNHSNRFCIKITYLKDKIR
jgi:hypothetical protein